MSIKKLSKFRCAVTIIRGRLFYCPVDDLGSISMTAGSFNWVKVEIPVPDGFLEAANQALNTHFTEEDIKSPDEPSEF